jgi:hypothetical protein
MFRALARNDGEPFLQVIGLKFGEKFGELKSVAVYRRPNDTP